MNTIEIILSIPIILLIIWIIMKIKDEAKYQNYNESYRKRNKKL